MSLLSAMFSMTQPAHRIKHLKLAKGNSSIYNMLLNKTQNRSIPLLFKAKPIINKEIQEHVKTKKDLHTILLKDNKIWVTQLSLLVLI